MNQKEFITLIESIGFKFDNYYGFFVYKEFIVSLWDVKYNFYNGSNWHNNIPLNELRPLVKYFKNELRSIKLKQLLR